jgi:membrane protease YdiL (CAAX protease family)
MFKRIYCDQCQTKYDELDKVCPKCGKENPFVSHKRFGDNALIVPFWMQIVLFAIGWLGFQLLGLILTFIVGVMDIEAVRKNALITFLAYGLLAGILIATQATQLKKYIRSAKNWLAPILGLAGFFAIMIFNFTYSIFLNVTGLSVTNNANEESIDSIITIYPLLSIIVIGIIGPLCEEFTYRVGLYSFFRRINKYLAYAITILVFAFIHFDFSSFATGGETLVNELLNLPYYMAAAFVFTFLYEKVGFFGAWAAHVTNNLYSVIFTLIASNFALKVL